MLNILSKGAFGVKHGKPGKGSLKRFTADNARKALMNMAEKGVQGDHPWKASAVQKVLVDNFGTVEKGIDVISSRAKLIPKSPPAWAPDRKQMPVVDKENPKKAAQMMNRGSVDWKRPYAKQ